MSDKTKRLDYLDMTKGLGMILVLIGHLQGDSIFTFSPYIQPLCVYIFSFHMPMFFIVSGIIQAMKNDDTRPFKDIAKNRFRGIMIPYFWFSFFYLLVVVVSLIKGEIAPQTLYLNIWYVLSCYGMNVLWFLPALYFGELLFIYLRRRIREHIPFIVVVVLSNAIVYVLAYLLGTMEYNTPFAMRMHDLLTVILRPVLVCGFISIGYYVHKLLGRKSKLGDFFNRPELNEKGKISIRYRLAYIVLGLMLFGVCFAFFRINNGIDFRSLAFRNVFFFLVCALSGSYCMISLCKGLPRVPLFCFWGVGSLIFMVTHNSQTVLQFALRTAMYANQYLTRARGYICYAIVIAIITAYSTLMIYIIRRFFPFMLGKPAGYLRKKGE
ncbi:MAG: acyltransferase family protein [Lachnospiraceae bacterium]|nr:acyltransferase family protein [Lachnospiraceae bacterium]